MTRVIVVATLAALLQPCASGAADKADPDAVTIGESDDGSKIALKMGQRLQVALPAQFGTGYSWQIVHLTEVLASLPSSVEGATPRPGGTEVQVLHFKACKAGSGTLVLGYRQPWNHDQPASKTFSLNITVQSSP